MERLLNILPVNPDPVYISRIQSNLEPYTAIYPYIVNDTYLKPNKNIYELNNLYYADDISNDSLKTAAGDYDSNTTIVLVYIDNNKRIHEIGNSEILFDSLFDFIKNNEGRIATIQDDTASSTLTGDDTWNL